MTKTSNETNATKIRGAKRRTAKARQKHSGGLSTRDYILKEATRLFAKEGFDRVTVRDISSATNLSMPTLYHYFGDKEKLYREVEAEIYGALRERLLNALEGKGDPEERLRSFVSEMYDALLRDVNFRHIAVRNMLDPSAVNHKFLVGVSMKPVHRALADLMNEIRPAGGDGPAPIMLMSGILGFVLMSPAKRQLTDYPFRRKADSKREREAFLDYIVGTVLRE